VLWSTIQGITRDGKGVQVAPLATDAYADQREQVQAIRDAGGASKVGDLAVIMILSNRGVLMHVRCQHEPIGQAVDPAAGDSQRDGEEGEAEAGPSGKSAGKRRARA